MQKWLPPLKEPSCASPTSLADITYQGKRIARPTESLTTAICYTVNLNLIQAVKLTINLFILKK